MCFYTYYPSNALQYSIGLISYGILNLYPYALNLGQASVMSLKTVYYIFTYLLGGVWGEQTTFKSQWSPSTMWVQDGAWELASFHDEQSQWSRSKSF